MISTLFKTLYSALGTRRKLAFENLALRQQIILQYSVKLLAAVQYRVA